jgi:YHS domain-containing protein
MNKKLFVVAVLVISSWQCFSQKGEIFSTAEGAIDGYDAVEYFTSGKPVKGQKDISFSWKGATWHFLNAENLDQFKKQPDRYAPQFGGYCAYGTAEGHKAPTQADAFAIVDNKLYFNYNKKVLDLWTKDQKALIEKANQQWPEVRKQQSY